MSRAAPWHHALQRFASAMRDAYGTRLLAVVLYGSRARGDAEQASDIDVLVVLDPGGDFWAEFDQISPVASRISLEFDVVISALPVAAEEYGDPHSPLLINARRDGVHIV